MYDIIFARQIRAFAALGIALLGSGAAMGATFTVTNRNDTTGGTCSPTGCSLRQAIAAANATAAADTIEFSMLQCGTNVINIGSQLRITRPVTIDGTTQPRCGAPAPGDNSSLIELHGPGVNVGTPAQITGLLLDAGSSGSTIRGLAINGFSANGIGINSSNNLIVDSKVGTLASGMTARPNRVGVEIADGTTGNDVASSVISGNSSIGIDIHGDRTQIYENLIGLAADGIGQLGNGGDGIATVGAIDSAIGIASQLGNTIAFNSGAGVHIGMGSSSNEVRGNQIHDNGGLGIRLDGGSANQGQPAPTIDSAVRKTQRNTTTIPPRIQTVTVISGSLPQVSGSSFQVDLYRNDVTCSPVSGEVEGELFLASGAVAADGTFSVTTTLPPGFSITAIGRSPDGDTSQFSACEDVAP